MNIQYLPLNEVGRDFVVGDIHGCYNELMSLLTHVSFNGECDRLLSVGDLIDRGPDSGLVLGLLTEPWFFSVMGNHEQMMIEGLTLEYYADDWMSNGGGWIIGYNHAERTELLNTVINLPKVIVVGKNTSGRFNVVHSQCIVDHGSLITDTILDSKEHATSGWDTMLWGRTMARIQHKRFQHPLMSITYAGHTPMDEPIQVERHIFIDGGIGHHYRDKDGEFSLNIVDHTSGIIYRNMCSTGRIYKVLIKDINKHNQ